MRSLVKSGDLFHLDTTAGKYEARAIISATGSFANPSVPEYPGIETFKGEVLHASQYRAPAPFRDKRVAIVGEGNSGAQILAEVSEVADTLWITQREPRFLADHIDGRYLFDAATQMYEAKKRGDAYQPPSLGDIVMVPPVKTARARRVFEKNVRPFDHFSAEGLVWTNGHTEKVDAVTFCTGYKPVLNHLTPLGIVNADRKAATAETKTAVEGLWLVGYGNWTGFASATLIGVGRTARQTVEEIKRFLTVPLDAERA